MALPSGVDEWDSPAPASVGMSPARPAQNPALSWLNQQAEAPRAPFEPVKDFTQNIQALGALPQRVYEGAKSLYQDPAAYFQNAVEKVKSLTPEDVAMSFNPAGVGMAGVIKPKGGNWLTGSVEKSVEPLKRYDLPNLFPELGGTPPNSPANEAVNKWVDRNLVNYVKNQMATPEDPVRKLAEEGIVHIPTDQVGTNRYKAPDRRATMGGKQLGQSEAARAWEDASDVALRASPIKHFNNLEPWMENADPNTKIYSLGREMGSLGFDHIIDVLKEDVASGRIRPEQLNKVSMEQAVRRVHEYDQDKAKKMRETQLKATEGMPVHKEYPEGFKWIELTTPKLGELPEGSSFQKLPSGMTQVVDRSGNQLTVPASNEAHALRLLEKEQGQKTLEDALKYEGDTMGHCVGGYCPDVISGRSRIYSLRDAKNEPHVTIEVQPNQHLDFNKWWDQQPQELREEINARARRGEHEGSVFEAPEYLAAREALPQEITQIKGKQNRAPNEQYLPYVQDFVKSGNWGSVGDLHNTGLNRIADKHFATDEELKALANRHYPEHPDMTPQNVIDHYNVMKSSPEYQDEKAKNFIQDIESNNYFGQPPSPEVSEVDLLDAVKKHYPEGFTDAFNKVKEHKMLQGVYRGYAGEAGAPEGTLFATPQKRVADYYAQKRAEQTGAAPHAEMLLVDPFAGKDYGHSTRGTGAQEPMFTKAKKLKPEDIQGRTQLYAKGGKVKAPTIDSMRYALMKGK